MIRHKVPEAGRAPEQTRRTGGEAPFADAAQRALFGLWRARRHGRAMPRRADFDTLELRPWMGDLHVVDVEDSGRQFRFRVFATNHARRLGYDLTARTVDALPSLLGDEARRVMRLAAAERRPFLARHSFVTVNEYRPVTRLLLPLAGADGGTERIFVHIHVDPLAAEPVRGRIWALGCDGAASEISGEA